MADAAADAQQAQRQRILLAAVDAALRSSDAEALAQLCVAHTGDARVFAAAADGVQKVICAAAEGEHVPLSLATCTALADAALAALRLHAADAHAVSSACGVVAQTVFSSDPAHAAVRARSVSPQAALAPTMVAAMRRHVGALRLHGTALLLLRDAAGDDAWQASVVAAGAPLAVVDTSFKLALFCLRRSEHAAAGRLLCNYGTQALFVLINATSPHSKAALQAAGATPALTAAMRALPESGRRSPAAARVRLLGGAADGRAAGGGAGA
jgi:hypothetical protein